MIIIAFPPYLCVLCGKEKDTEVTSKLTQRVSALKYCEGLSHIWCVSS